MGDLFMNVELLLQTLNFIFPLSNALDKRFRESLVQENLSKRHLLLEEGSIANKIYFINKGFARAYYTTRQGRECTSWFDDQQFAFEAGQAGFGDGFAVEGKPFDVFDE